METGSIPAYGSGGIMRYVNKAIYGNESILIPRKGTLSNLFYINQPFWSVETMFYTKLKTPYCGKYLFFLLQTMKLASLNVGTAVPSLTTGLLNKIKIMVPAESVLKRFTNSITPMFKMKDHNIQQTQQLTELRDFLLPMLMNGQVKVN